MQPGWVLVIITAVVAAVVIGRMRNMRPVAPVPRPEATPPSGDEQERPPGYADPRLHVVYELERAIQSWPQATRPDDLLALAAFRALVEHLASAEFTDDDRMSFAAGERVIPAWAALAAFAAKPADPAIAARLYARLNAFHPWTRHFTLIVLEAWAGDGPTFAGHVLMRLDENWQATELQVVLEDFLRRRAAIGPLTFAGLEWPHGYDPDVTKAVLNRSIDPALQKPLLDALAEWEEAQPPGPTVPATPPTGASPPVPGAGTVGLTYVPGAFEAADLHPLASGDAAIVSLVDLFTGPRPRSALVVGDSGVGKSAVMRGVARRLTLAGWTIVEASPVELNAGAKFVGMLEERIQTLVNMLSRPKTLWLAADFHMLQGMGRYNLNPTGALEMLMPPIRSGRIRVLGEVRPAAFDRMCEQQPDVERAFEVLRVEPPADAELDGLLAEWSQALANTRGVEVLAALRREAVALSQQYLSAMKPPGGVLRLLEDAAAGPSRHATPEKRAPLTIDDVLGAIARLTGMPLDVLDERRALDLDALQAAFERRVIGQGEAVRCLIERLAMIKAGVTDPTRPYGVFLCAGGSGTGKTELAKTCAELLFGSPDRLIRLDMSELQSPQSIERLTGRSTVSQTGGSLAERVRRQPFSVVLLDEFEKAHPLVWYVFLQVFDAGRLADEAGELADFRHTILVLTSNLGTGATAGDAPLGLVSAADRFSPTTVQRAIERAFRPELLNRLDRVLVFRPLTRDVMRRILHKELAQAFERRGLRTRQWAVELEESAERLLLDTGFSPQYGARPLKRALERLLLAPIARTIVDRRAPEGEQFLFVRADGDQLAVEFVDPDAAPGAARDAAAVDGGLAAMVYDPKGSHEEIGHLRETLRALAELTGSDDWRAHKQALFEEMAAPGFWDRTDRHERLGRAEYLDRIESALRSTQSLLARLDGYARQPRPGYSRELVRRVAQSLFLLDAATHEALTTGPRDAFLAIEPVADIGRDDAGAFAARLDAMYEAWAVTRGMRWRALGTSGDRTLFAVSGFAAYALLAPEDGLHVLEPDARDDAPRRITVRVRVAPQPAEPADGDGLRRAAIAAFTVPAAGAAVVRRYRDGATPLVRDAVRRWRTGRIERVFAGNFDVMPGESAGAAVN